MSMIYIELIIFFVSLMFAGIFAFTETAFTALRLFKVTELKASFSKYKNLFTIWEKNPQAILITILIANNFAHVLCSVLIANIMEKLLGGFGLIIAVILATILILLFGEIIPKTLAKAHCERIFKRLLFLINFIFNILYPLVNILLKITNFIFQKMGRDNLLSKKQEDISEKELEFLIDYSDEKGIIESEKSEMLQNVFGLGQTLVKEIMVPKTDMVLINIEANLHDAIDLFSKYRLSRLPVYEVKDDNIVGFIHQKDIFEVLYKEENKKLKDLIRPILFVPESKKTNQLLNEFLTKRMHMSVLIDEYGGVVGLVTLEDVLEEIVGEIRDEHENIRAEIVPLEKGGWLMDASISLDKLEKLLKIKFKVEASVTLAGFLSEKLQSLPKKGERLYYEGYCFQIQQASSKRVFQVLVFEDKDKKGSI